MYINCGVTETLYENVPKIIIIYYYNPNVLILRDIVTKMIIIKKE